MQQEPNETFQEDPVKSRASEATPVAHYGRDSSHQPPTSRSRPIEVSPETQPFTPSVACSEASSEASGEATESKLRRLNQSRQQTCVDRVSEHERALTGTGKKRRDGPAFTVIQKTKTPGTHGLLIADFPNGTSCRHRWRLGS